MTIDGTHISVWVVLAAVAIDAVVVCLMMLGAVFGTRAYRRRQAMQFAAFLASSTVEALHALRTPLDAASLAEMRAQVDASLEQAKTLTSGDGEP